MVTQIDANIGRLLDKLEDLGIAENTVIIFTSDHGDMQGSHGLVNKCLPHEESAGIPLIISAPNSLRGKVTRSLASGVDYMPTILDFAGTDAPAGLPGRSLKNILYDKDATQEEPVFVECRKWRMIRTKSWKFVIDKDKPVYLFDMENDPNEMKNLIDSPQHSQKIEELHLNLNEWYKNCQENR